MCKRTVHLLTQHVCTGFGGRGRLGKGLPCPRACAPPVTQNVQLRGHVVVVPQRAVEELVGVLLNGGDGLRLELAPSGLDLSNQVGQNVLACSGFVGSAFYFLQALQGLKPCTRCRLLFFKLLGQRAKLFLQIGGLRAKLRTGTALSLGLLLFEQAHLLDDFGNAFRVLWAATGYFRIALRTRRVQLHLQCCQLLGYRLQLGAALCHVDTLGRAEQFALLNDFTGHGRLPLGKSNVRVSQALSAIDIQRLGLLHKSSHGVCRGCARLLALELCLTCRKLVFAHCLDLLGHVVQDQTAFAGRQAGQRRLGFNHQQRFVRVLHQVVRIVLRGGIVRLGTRQLHALSSIRSGDVCHAGTFCFFGLATLDTGHQRVLKSVAGVFVSCVFFGSCDFSVANLARALQHVVHGRHACNALLLQRLLVHARLFQAVDL